MPPRVKQAARPPGPVPPPPGMRRGNRQASGALPDGIAPPGSRRASSQGPAAKVPFSGPPQPDSQFMALAACMVFIGLTSMGSGHGAGSWVLGLFFALVGLLIGGVWIRLWMMWRRAWGGGKWL